MSTPPDARERGRAFAQCAHEPRIPAWLLTAAAVLLHGGLFAAALYLSAPTPSHAKTTPKDAPLLEVDLTPPPAPEEPPPPPEAEPEPVKLKVVKAPPPPAVTPPPEAEPKTEEPPKAEEPPPAAAETAAALTATEDAPDAPSDTLVTGNAGQYAGGMSAQGGTAKEAVHAPNAHAAGVPNGTGTAPVDRSRDPRLAAGTDWNCPFPEEAVEDGIERATVGLEVEIAASGAVLGVTVRDDPGSGFGREARACALKKHWLPALGKDGLPMQRKHRVNVTFIQR